MYSPRISGEVWRDVPLDLFVWQTPLSSVTYSQGWEQSKQKINIGASTEIPSARPSLKKISYGQTANHSKMLAFFKCNRYVSGRVLGSQQALFPQRRYVDSISRFGVWLSWLKKASVYTRGTMRSQPYPITPYQHIGAVYQRSTPSVVNQFTLLWRTPQIMFNNSPGLGLGQLQDMEAQH